MRKSIPSYQLQPSIMYSSNYFSEKYQDSMKTNQSSNNNKKFGYTLQRYQDNDNKSQSTSDSYQTIAKKYDIIDSRQSIKSQNFIETLPQNCQNNKNLGQRYQDSDNKSQSTSDSYQTIAKKYDITDSWQQITSKNFNEIQPQNGQNNKNLQTFSIDSYKIISKYYDSSVTQQLNQSTGKDLCFIINQLESNIEKIMSKKKKVIFLIGNTGVGKTTLAAFLSGLPLKVCQNEFNQSYFEYMYSFKEQTSKIGQSEINSQTYFPNIFESSSDQVYIDCPGFSDSNGIQYDIINSFFIHSFQKQALAVKIVLTIDGSLLQCIGDSGKCMSYKILFEKLLSMMYKTNFNFLKNLIIVITKCQVSSYSLEFYQQKLHTIIKSIETSVNYQKQLSKYKFFGNKKQFFQQLSNASICLFPCPQSDKEWFKDDVKIEVLTALEKVEYYQLSDFRVSLSEQQFLKLCQYFSQAENLIDKNIQKIFDSIMEQISNSTLVQIRSFQTVFSNFEKLISNWNPSNSSSECIQLLEMQLINPFLSQIKKRFSNLFTQSLHIIEFLERKAFNLLLKKIDENYSFSHFLQNLLMQKIKISKEQVHRLQEAVIQKEETQSLMNELSKKKCEYKTLQNEVSSLSSTKQKLEAKNKSSQRYNFYY